MTDKEISEKLQNLKTKIADVLIHLNLCESTIKGIVADYVRSERNYFVKEVMLNNAVISFGAKIRILLIIMKAEDIEIKKEFKEALHMIIGKRNIIAHSDTLTMDFDIEAYAADDPLFTDFKVKLKEPETMMFDNHGGINFERVEKIIEDFDKYYQIAIKGLFEVDLALSKKRLDMLDL